MKPLKKLLQVGTDAKTVKGQKKGYLTGILYLAPAKLSGYEVCPQRSAGCTAACLNTAGRGVFSNVQASRIAKTKWYFEDRAAFMALLVKDIAKLVRKAEREGMVPVVRLNGTSDIPWERVAFTLDGEGYYGSVMSMFPNVHFYDYTKITKRALAHAKGDMPANYTLVYSLTEENDPDAVKVLTAGGNIAAVLKPFADGGLPPRMVVIGGEAAGFEQLVPCSAYASGTYRQYQVVDGDETDLRFLDDKGVIVGLKAKGKARYDTSGFVR